MDDQLIRNTLSRRLLELYSYWSNARPDGPEEEARLPLRSSLDPVDIPKLLSMLILAEMKYESGDIRTRFRLIGTETVNHWGRDMTGKYLDEILEGDYLNYLATQYREVAEKKKPLYAHYILRFEDYKITSLSRLYLPYTRENEEGRVTDILVGQIIRNDAHMVMQPMNSGLNSIKVMEIERVEL